MSEHPAAQAAKKIIEMLEDRGGFDDWWAGIDDDTQREILDRMMGIIDAAPAPAAARPRPKLELVDWGDPNHVTIYVNGTEVAEAFSDPGADGRTRVQVARDVAETVGRALGADIDETADPMREPYVYFIAYDWSNDTTRRSGIASVWHSRPTPIEDADSLEISRQAIMTEHPERGNVVITNFILTSGPC